MLKIFIKNNKIYIICQSANGYTGKTYGFFYGIVDWGKRIPLSILNLKEDKKWIN